MFPRFPYHRKMNCSRPTSRPTICPFASHPVPDFDTLSPVPLPWLSLVFLVLFITIMVVRTLKGKGEADVAGWQLVKCTSTDFSPTFSRLVSRPFPSHREIISSHPIPSTFCLPAFPSRSHPAVHKREGFPVPLLGKTLNIFRYRA